MTLLGNAILALLPISAGEAAIVAGPDIADVEYIRRGEQSLRLDIFLPNPQRAKPAPVILCFHGGAWEKGEKSNQWTFARELAARGYAAAVIEYRLSGVAPFPAALVDARAAVRWLHREASALGLDSQRLFATGHSAGGHLAALLATSAEAAFGDDGEPPHVRAAVALAAHTDLRIPHIGLQSALPEQPFWAKFLGGTQAEAPATYARASAHAHVTPSAAPLLLVAGEKDHASTRGDEIRATYAALGLTAELAIIAGAPHDFMGNAVWRTEAAALAIAFFDRFSTPP